MILHGDDIYNYKDIRYNMSSNVYNGFDHSGLFAHLAKVMPCIANYPEPTPHTLEAMIANHLGIDADNVMVTNGATEAIYLIAQAYSGCSSIIYQPTFAEYAEACRIMGHSISYSQQSISLPHGGVGGDSSLAWLCNPNNPTGEVTPKETLLNIIRNTPDTTFVIDQSYDRFTLCDTLSAVEAVNENNVLVLHSMTKEYAIPGLRLGYVIGSTTLLSSLRQHRMPWSVNSLAIEAGKYLVQHTTDYVIDVTTLISEAQRVAARLRDMDIHVAHSDTHILLCQLPNHGITIRCQLITTAADLKSLLANHYGILIRDASNFHALTPQHFRIAVQFPTINDVFLAAITAGL